MSGTVLPSGAVFVGIARNVNPYMRGVLSNVEKCAQGFANKRIIIVENDSTDGTQETLQSWANRSREQHIYIRAAECPSGDRTERLAYFRNIYLREVEKDEYKGFDYVIVFDCDNIISSWIDKRGVISSVQFLAAGEQAAAVFASTRSFYYDVWTLRHPTWCPEDCWEEVKRMSVFTSRTEAILSCVGARQVRINTTSAPIPVTSAFGGLAVYKRAHLLGRRYSAKNPDGSPACEHVALNESIARDGGKLFIFPQLVVKTPYEHIHRARDKHFYRVRLGEYAEDWKRWLVKWRRRFVNGCS
jgi:glycosyltransferase involved in cell wall biosynthesis